MISCAKSASISIKCDILNVFLHTFILRNLKDKNEI